MIACLTAVAAVPQGALELYERALVQENAAGNLAAAIDLYKQVAKQAGGDRSLAAKALIRAAAAYEKLSQPEAAQLYAEVMRTYPEQREQVAVAQARLAVLRRTSPRGGRTDVSAILDPLLDRYCITCHNQTRNLANINLAGLNTHNVAENTDVWENVLRNLRRRLHPSPGNARPSEDAYQSAVSSLELALDQAYPPSPSDKVTDSELAYRLAKFLWGGDPDVALINVAQRGTLRDPQVLEQQVRRMLRDPKSTSLVTNFFMKWSGTNSLKFARPDAMSFPDFDPMLIAAFQRETELFFESQLREDRGAMELWTANYTYVDERLGRFYGIPNTSGRQFQRVTFNDNRRAGLLGQGSVLTVTSIANRTSPTKRGIWVLETFFGKRPPEPPPNVPPLRGGDNGRDMRTRLAEHTTNPACANCHGIFESFGYALENFDGVGQWQNAEQSVPVDTSGSFADGVRFNGPAEFRAGLLKYREAFLSNVAEKLLANALGRPNANIYPYEMKSVRAIVRASAPDNYRWSSIIAGIVQSGPFQSKNIVP